MRVHLYIAIFANCPLAKVLARAPSWCFRTKVAFLQIRYLGPAGDLCSGIDIAAQKSYAYQTEINIWAYIDLE